MSNERTREGKRNEGKGHKELNRKNGRNVGTHEELKRRNGRKDGNDTRN